MRYFSRTAFYLHSPLRVLPFAASSLPKRATLDGNASLLDFPHKLEAACIETVESGEITKDLAILIHGPKVSRELYLNNEEFINAVAQNLESKLHAPALVEEKHGKYRDRDAETGHCTEPARNLRNFSRPNCRKVTIDKFFSDLFCSICLVYAHSELEWDYIIDPDGG